MPPTLKQTTADPDLHQRLLDTHGHMWVSFLWGHCSFLLGHGVHDLKSLFPQSWLSSGASVAGLMATSSKRIYAIPRSATPWAPAAGHCWPVPPQETLRHSPGSVSVGWACVLHPSQVWAAQVTRCLVRAPSQVCCMSLLESWSQAATLLAYVNHPGSQEDWLAAGNLLTVWWKMPSLDWDYRLPLCLWARRGWYAAGSQLVFLIPLCCDQAKLRWLLG